MKWSLRLATSGSRPSEARRLIDTHYLDSPGDGSEGYARHAPNPVAVSPPVAALVSALPSFRARQMGSDVSSFRHESGHSVFAATGLYWLVGWITMRLDATEILTV